MKKTLQKHNPIQSLRQNSGQILMEYLLLTAVIVGIVTLSTRLLVRRGDQPGVIIRTWVQLNQMIAADESD